MDSTLTEDIRDLYAVTFGRFRSVKDAFSIIFKRNFEAVVTQDGRAHTANMEPV